MSCTKISTPEISEVRVDGHGIKISKGGKKLKPFEILFTALASLMYVVDGPGPDVQEILEEWERVPFLKNGSGLRGSLTRNPLHGEEDTADILKIIDMIVPHDNQAATPTASPYSLPHIHPRNIQSAGTESKSRD